MSNPYHKFAINLPIKLKLSPRQNNFQNYKIKIFKTKNIHKTLKKIIEKTSCNFITFN